jgi:hypothetical protein
MRGNQRPAAAQAGNFLAVHNERQFARITSPNQVSPSGYVNPVLRDELSILNGNCPMNLGGIQMPHPRARWIRVLLANKERGEKKHDERKNLHNE